MIMGKTRFQRGFVVCVAIAFLTTLPACRKLGLDDAPRTMPNGAPASSLGPKRQPISQHSALNTPEASRAAMRGAVSPDPAAMASMGSTDGYSAYAGNNFWANGNGWAANPQSLQTMNSAAPTQQMQPPMMMQQQQPMAAYAQPQPPMQMPQQQAFAAPQQPMFAPQQQQQQQPQMMQQQNGLPPISALRQPSSGFGAPAAAIPQQQAYNQYQQTPQTSMPQNMGNSGFPKLQEIPNEPFYRSSQEINNDVNSLQSQSASNMLGQNLDGWQNTPAYPSATPQPPMAPQPVALQDNYNNNQYGQIENAFGGASAPMSGSDDFAYGNQQNSGNYDSAGFVPPAPVAGVSDTPMAAQDWDNGAYGGGNQGGANNNAGMNQPLQLQAPNSTQPSFLPSSRYQGRSASNNRAAAVPATMNYGY